MKLITLKIEGMKCEMCESHICDCIRKGNPNAKKVKASHRKNEASFVIEDNEDAKESIFLIKQEGYEVLSCTEGAYEKKNLFSFFCKK